MDIRIRELRATDTVPLQRLLRRVAVFETHEIAVAEELLGDALAGSPDYLIYVAEGSDTRHDPAERSAILGYVCHGLNPVTDAMHDLYWIAVDPAAQRLGVGRALIAHTEGRVRVLRGRGIVVETSSRTEYAPARRLYEQCGYQKAAEIPDFYKPGDGMIVYLKFL